MTHKPPQGIDAPNCAHKQLKKQMVGEQCWYICECGHKFRIRIELWDGKVSVLAPPDPRKDLAALEEAQIRLDEAEWWDDNCGLPGRGAKMRANRLAELEQRLAEMHGAKR